MKHDTAFTKVVRIGTMKVWNGYRDVDADIHCEIEYRGKMKLSIHGVIGAKHGGDALGGSGQIDMEFSHRNPKDNDSRYSHPVTPNDIAFAPGWSAELWYDFLDVWKRWHLNDMRAGSPKQEAYLREHGRGKDYAENCAILQEAGLYEDNGYKYGHAWNFEQVPDDVLDWILALPDADRMPAWI